MIKPRFSIRIALVAIAITSVYFALVLRSKEQATVHSRKFADIKTNESGLWPADQLTSITDFSASDRTGWLDTLLLRTKVTYRYGLRLTQKPHSWENHKCRTAFSVGPFSSKLISHSQTMTSEFRYSNFPISRESYQKY